jgi:hypothetical protein
MSRWRWCSMFFVFIVFGVVENIVALNCKPWLALLVVPWFS